jgi:hypothetical protein
VVDSTRKLIAEVEERLIMSELANVQKEIAELRDRIEE